MKPMDELLGVSRAIVSVREQAQQLLARGRSARRLPPILLQGETGTGKGLLARLIHRESLRHGGPFIDVSCAAIPDALVEAELFGFERGAFTDARHAKPGLLHAAHRGTLFLDEVGLLPESLQAKLLKVIEEQVVRRLGSTRAESIDVQVIAASNEDLAEAARSRRFRHDLYHRLAVVTLTLPALRHRHEDILLLAEHFLSRACSDYGLLPSRRFAPDAGVALQEHPWPGNVRELSNVIESAVLLAEESTITAAMLRLPTRSWTDIGRSGFDDRVGDLEREQLLSALNNTNWNVSRAAIQLGISRNRLRYRIEKHRLDTGRDLVRSGQHDVRISELVAPILATHPPSAAAGPSLRWERQHLALLRAEIAPAAAAGPPPEPARALTVIAEKIRSFGGDVQEVAAMTMVGAFGLEPVENASNSAALAALAIQRAARRARQVDPRIPTVKIVVHAVHLMVGRIDGVAQISLEDKRAIETILAALSNAGQPDDIVVSAAAAPFLERRFELERDSPEHGPAALYHLTRPERTGYGLGGRALAPFVGRERELAIVREQLAQAERDRGQIVAVVGEPGVGKSRFVYELISADRMGEWKILRGGGVSHGVTKPSLPVVELLKRYFHIDDADTPSHIREKVSQKILQQHSRLGPHLPALLALLDVSSEDMHWRALEPAQRRQRTLDAVKHLLLQESLAQPLLVIFEDLHWIDTETQGLLDSLVESLPVARLLLLVTYRPEYQHHWDGNSYYTQLHLDPLTGESAEVLLQHMLGEDASLLPLKRLLVDRTEGNPLFLEETVRALAETAVLQGRRGDYRLNAPAASLEVPATVQAILLARIERLSPEHKRLLQAAAVVGKDVPYPLLHAIDELPEKRLREGLTALQRGGFLYDASRFPDLAYTFKHALTHEVAYSALGQEQRRSLHSKVLHAIERLYAERLAEQLEQLGYHSFHAEAWDKAVAYLRQSGEKAYNRSASREAMVAYDQALAALAHLPKTRETLEQAVDLRLELRNVLHSIGEFGRLFGCLDDAERLAQALGDQRRVARVLGFVAFSSTLMGDHDRAIASGERALAIAEAIHDLGVQVVANNYVGLAYFYRGNYPRAIAFHRRNLACLPSDLIRERFGLPVFPTVLARAYVAWSSAELGQFTDGIASGEHGVQTATALDQPFSQIWAEFSLGYLYLRKGDLDKAAHILERALDRLDRHHIPFVFPFVASLLGATRVSSGQLSEGLELLEHALEVAVSMKNELFRVLLLGWLSEGYSLTGRTGDAFEHAQHALKLSRDYKERGWEAWTLRLLGEIASCRDLRQFQDAKDSYQQALAIAKELRMEPLVAHCQLGLGKLYRDTGQPEQASGHMATATKMYEGMHMESWVEKTKGALR